MSDKKKQMEIKKRRYKRSLDAPQDISSGDIDFDKMVKSIFSEKNPPKKRRKPPTS